MGDTTLTAEILPPPTTRPETRVASGQLRFEERMTASFILKSLSAETCESYRRVYLDRSFTKQAPAIQTGGSEGKASIFSRLQESGAVIPLSHRSLKKIQFVARLSDCLPKRQACRVAI